VGVGSLFMLPCLKVSEGKLCLALAFCWFTLQVWRQERPMVLSPQRMLCSLALMPASPGTFHQHIHIGQVIFSIDEGCCGRAFSTITKPGRGVGYYCSG
jgi:hypothetical protein